MFYKDDILYMVIDGPSILSTSRGLGIKIDFTDMKSEFARRGRLKRIEFHVFTDIQDGSCQPQGLIDFLSYNGYVIRRRPVLFDDCDGWKKPRGGLNVDVAISCLNAAPHCDHIVLASGDNDLTGAVAECQRLGCRVSLLSSLKGSSPSVGDQLRRQVDNFIEMDDLRDTISQQSTVS